MTESKVCKALAQANEYALDAGDVSVEKIRRPLCDDCNERPATHAVLLDMRNCATKVEVAHLCSRCAKQFARNLKASLPPDRHD